MSYTIKAACISSPGKIRFQNEDNFSFAGVCLQPDDNRTKNILQIEKNAKGGLFFAVFDGMGGENYGEIASFVAAREALNWEPVSEVILQDLRDLTRRMNLVVVGEAQSRLTRHMGSTVAALYFREKEVFLCNVGDSRAYRLRNGILVQLSEDHVDNPEKIGIHIQRKPYLSQYLGVPPEEFEIEPCLFQEDGFPGDRYLLCSDGLTDMASKEEIKEIMEKSSDVETGAGALVDLALAHGGKDNITVILCEIV